MERATQTLGKEIVATKDALKAKKATYSSLCDTISHYFCPAVEVLEQTNDGGEIIQPITSTGMVASTRLQNGLYSNTMAMGKGNIRSPDKQVMGVPIAKNWYAELSNTVQHHVAQSGFAKKFQEWIGDYVNFGGSVLYPYWDKVKKQHFFYSYAENDCFYTLDPAGELYSMYREYEWTAEQAVNKFGYDILGDKIQKAYDTRNEEALFQFTHCMRPRRMRDENSTNAKQMAFESIHVLESGENKVVLESGSDQMRYVIAHFSQKQGESNGRSPAFSALPVIKTITRIVDLLMNATELAIGSPVWFPDKNAAETAQLEPFFVGYFDPSKGAPWQYQIDPAALRENKELFQFLAGEIDQLFFVDLFAMLEQQKTGAKTAYEVSQLVAERTQAIAPVANSLGGFFRDVYRIVALDLIRSGQVDKPPVEVFDPTTAEVMLEVIYTSRLDIRLKEIENVSMLEGVNQAAQFNAAVDQSPVISSVVKALEGTIAIFESHNLDPSVLNNIDEAKKELQAMQQAAMEQKQAEMAQQAVKPLDLQAPVQENSLMGGMQGGAAAI